MPPNSGPLLPAGHRLLPEPDREGPACLPCSPNPETHPPTEHQPNTRTTHADSAHNRSRKQCPSARHTAHSPRGSAVHSGPAHLRAPHTPFTQTHLVTHSDTHSISHKTNPLHTHTYKLSHIHTHVYAHSFSRTYMLTFIHRHSQIPAPKSPHGPISAFCLPHSCNPQPHPAGSPTPGPKTVVLVPESLSQPDHPFALRCSLEPKGHL